MTDRRWSLDTPGISRGGGINAGGGKINVPGAGVVGEVKKRAAEGPVELGWCVRRTETKGSASGCWSRVISPDQRDVAGSR